MYEMMIVNLNNDGGKYKHGDYFEVEDINGAYMSIFFASTKSIDAMIHHLQGIKAQMEADNGRED